MDHLPILKHDKLPYPPVPCKASAYVPTDSFAEYPQQHGHRDLKKHLDADRPFDWHKGLQVSSSEIGFLQTWLYFGTLYEVSCAGNEPTTHLNNFIKETPDGVNREITSEGLDKFLRRHIGALKPGLKPAKKAERFRRLDAVLAKVCAITKSLYQPFKEHMQAHDGLLSKNPSAEFCIILSIKILGCTVDNALYGRLGNDTIEKWRMGKGEKEGEMIPMEEHHAQSEQRRDWELRSFAEERMASDNWCPRDVDLVKGFLSELSMFAASYIARGNRDQNHKESGRQCDRFLSNCQELLKQDTSKPSTARHTAHLESERCTFWPPDTRAHQRQLRVIISGKRIPYLEIREARKTAALTVTLKSMDNTYENTGYGAGGVGKGIFIVSHVWSEGLGSDLAQLPMCQLQRLFHIALGHGEVDYKAKPDRKSFSRRHFKPSPMVKLWIDTLCLPAITWKPAAEREMHMKSEWGKAEKHYKTMGIQMMKRYYSASQVAIALDGELIKIKMKGSDNGELLLRIALSGWMRRCWCFIEAINSGGFIKVSFADGLFDLTHAIVSRAFYANDSWFYLMSSSQRKWVWAFRSIQIVATALLITYIVLSVTWNPGNIVTLTYESAKLLEIWMVSNLVGRHQIVPNITWVIERLRGLIAKTRGVRTSRRGIASTSDRFTLECSTFFVELGKLWLEGSLSPKSTRRFKRITTARQAVVWEGFKHRHVSSRHYRVVTFGYACAKHKYEFKTMERITNSMARIEQRVADSEHLRIPEDAPEDLRKKIKAQRADERTEEVLRMWLVGQRVIPVGLLFLGGGKMRLPGYRWAPTDIQRESIKDGGIAKCLRVTKKTNKSGQPEGSLQFKKPALILTDPLKLQLTERSPRRLDPLFIEERGSKAHFRVDWPSIDEDEAGTQASNWPENHSAGAAAKSQGPENEREPVTPDGLRTLIARSAETDMSALIISDGEFLDEPRRMPIFKSQTKPRGSLPSPGRHTSPAALVAISIATDGTTYNGIFCGTATVTKVSGTESHNYLGATTAGSKRSWVVS